MKILNFLIINNLMKFKKFSISLAILICLMKICTCQLFEQFNDEPSALEKGTKSLFEQPEEKVNSINSIFGGNDVEKNISKNTVPSLFGSAENDLIRPIEAPKAQLANKQPSIPQTNQIIKNDANKITKKNVGPIKNLSNQVKKPSAESNKNNNLGKINYKII